MMQQPKKPTSKVRRASSRFFNTTGPCNPVDHYMLPSVERLVGAQLTRYVSSKLFWVLHAPRQTGKTTFMQSWMRELNASGTVIACYVSVEICQDVPEPERAMPAIVEHAISSAEMQTGTRLSAPPAGTSPLNMLTAFLREWAAQVAPKPLVVLFDEVDTLKDQTMVSFLRQLRSGFSARGVGRFPVSVALVGMRDLRDYLIKSKDLIGSSIFRTQNRVVSSNNPAALTRGRPSQASATRPEILGAVVQVPRLSPLHLAPVTDGASRRPQVRGQRPPARPDGTLRPDVGGGLPRGVIVALWY